ncbi:hypothetical protein AVEN_161279-1 [Araneus ventricosus]|uniref:Uncharacterized protein n=1 Tax=Araneus ventricosus TaxID=182803 RepID=A0A4Y2I9T7_ARAVE|nr:hypothetical protein AVEN_161279-1 [Araneus ventricosus]
MWARFHSNLIQFEKSSVSHSAPSTLAAIHCPQCTPEGWEAVTCPRKRPAWLWKVLSRHLEEKDHNTGKTSISSWTYYTRPFGYQPANDAETELSSRMIAICRERGACAVGTTTRAARRRMRRST